MEDFAGMSGVSIECNNPQSVSEITELILIMIFGVDCFSNKPISPAEWKIIYNVW